MLFKILGLEFWLFPRLFDTGSIIPLINVQHSRNGLFGSVFRVFSFLMLVWVMYLSFFDQDKGAIYWDSSFGKLSSMVQWAHEKAKESNKKDKNSNINYNGNNYNGNNNYNQYNGMNGMNQHSSKFFTYIKYR